MWKKEATRIGDPREGKKRIIAGLLEEYDIESASDIIGKGACLLRNSSLSISSFIFIVVALSLVSSIFIWISTSPRLHPLQSLLLYYHFLPLSPT